MSYRNITVTLSENCIEMLEVESKETGINISFIAMEALERYLYSGDVRKRRKEAWLREARAESFISKTKPLTTEVE